jgi:AmmeMemoRadiSam system protein B
MVESIRRAAVAGSFYPAETKALQKLLEGCVQSHPLGPRGAGSYSSCLFGGMVPHAGLVYSGACAAHFYSVLPPDLESVIVLGVNHRGTGSDAALSPADFWETPLGVVRVEREPSRTLSALAGFVAEDETAHRFEHSIEVQLPFLQTVLQTFSFVPVSLAHISDHECARLGQAVAQLYEKQMALGKKTIVIASSDLSHYLSPEETERLDRLVLGPVLALDPAALLEAVRREHISMCGVIPTAVFLEAGKTLGAKRARLLKHCHSGDVSPMKEVVGYASVAVEF